MKTVIKVIVYTILAMSLGQTFDVTGQHSLAITYYSLLGFATYELMKLEEREELKHVKRS
ncbi:hypothetical protein ERX37_07665 [Macrococcus hajekii]|uniref:Uncharacterized protein n=1 Tax=Macrococcus hajekii TaxID=198482 RepID=A0A4R6BK97_9STAP|nr:hypothetical protein [Macrococcus hajekii]TDM02070.1 hypothetical protein ERX37_07665 [Macrococcus hajekii]GGB09812.1 hypothetical protein GCM10007190_17380 [Macrococcus hajekii]